MKRFMFALVAAMGLLGASPVALAGHGSGAAWFAGGFLFGNLFAPRVETVYYAPPSVVYLQPVVYSQPVAPVAVATPAPAPVTVTYAAPPPATVVYTAPPPVTVYYAPPPVYVAPVYYRHRHFRCW